MCVPESFSSLPFEGGGEDSNGTGRTSLAFISGMRVWNLEMSPALNANSKLRIKSCSVPLSASKIGCINCTQRGVTTNQLSSATATRQEIQSQRGCEVSTHQLAKVVDRLPEQRRDPEVVRALDPLGGSQVLLDVDAREVPERVAVIVGELGFRLCEARIGLPTEARFSLSRYDKRIGSN